MTGISIKFLNVLIVSISVIRFRPRLDGGAMSNNAIKVVFVTVPMMNKKESFAFIHD